MSLLDQFCCNSYLHSIQVYCELIHAREVLHSHTIILSILVRCISREFYRTNMWPWTLLYAQRQIELFALMMDIVLVLSFY